MLKKFKSDSSLFEFLTYQFILQGIHVQVHLNND